MTERERFFKILKKEKPDRVPWFADLGHWYRAEAGSQWSLFSVSNNYLKEIIDLHNEVRAGWYIDALSLHEEYYEDGVIREREIIKDKAVEHYRTPIGEIRMERRWNQTSFSWDITKLMAETPKDLEVLTYAIERRKFRPRYENWDELEKMTGHAGLGFPNLAYTGLGSLMSYYMGVENTVYAIYDEPELFNRYIEIYNRKHLELVDLYCSSPAPHMIFSDNLSSDVQPPDIFRRFSYDHYNNIAKRFHGAGKTVSAHLDGRLSNIIGIVAETGIDVADAVTPLPNGDLSPHEIRRQAGNEIILFGGISPDKWLPETSEEEFISHVRKWLDLRCVSPWLVQSAGDQVPPGTELSRIKLMYDLVEEYGKI